MILITKESDKKLSDTKGVVIGNALFITMSLRLLLCFVSGIGLDFYIWRHVIKNTVLSGRFCAK